MIPHRHGDQADKHLQLAEEDDDAPLGCELRAFEHLDEAQRLERLAESEIVTTLQLGGFDPASPEWKEFAGALAEYGYAVFVGWGITGSLHRVASQHGGGRGVYGLGKIPEGRRLDEDDARGLATDLIIVAIDAFRTKTLMNKDRAWRPTAAPA